MQDANFNVTAVTDDTGAVVERYAYTPYGEVTVLDDDFSADSDGKSDISNEHLYTGRRRDPETGLQLNRNRFYAAGLGRWVNRDPIGYRGGPNLYEYVNGMPLDGLDPSGFIGAVDCAWEHLKCVARSNKTYQGCYANANGSWWKNYLCELANNARKAQCASAFAACKSVQGLECCYATAADALDWARRNPKKVVIGATVCVGGALFIWGTGGAGAPILIAL